MINHIQNLWIPDNFSQSPLKSAFQNRPKIWQNFDPKNVNIYISYHRFLAFEEMQEQNLRLIQDVRDKDKGKFTKI